MELFLALIVHGIVFYVAADNASFAGWFSYYAGQRPLRKAVKHRCGVCPSCRTCTQSDSPDGSVDAARIYLGFGVGWPVHFVRIDTNSHLDAE